MNVYCVMSGESRTDLDHVVYASTSKSDAEMFAYKNEFYDYSGNPYIEVLDVAESEDKCEKCEYYRNPDYTRCHKCKAESEE